MPEDPYNPLDKKNLGVSVAETLLSRPRSPLPPEEVFLGAGVYAIYYAGEFPLYKPISLKTRQEKTQVPIYVGKAVPAGARKGAYGLEAVAGPVLYNRLFEHAVSLKQSQNLDVEDFSCRYLVVDDIWIPLGESLLIARFSPVWNQVVDGFGNHDPGAGRHQGRKPMWDVIHPGRPWADRLKGGDAKPKADIVKAVSNHLSKLYGNKIS